MFCMARQQFQVQLVSGGLHGIVKLQLQAVRIMMASISRPGIRHDTWLVLTLSKSMSAVTVARTLPSPTVLATSASTSCCSLAS